MASAARFCGLRKLRKYPLGTSVRMPLTPSPCTSSLRTTCGRIQQMSQVRLVLPVKQAILNKWSYVTACILTAGGRAPSAA